MKTWDDLGWWESPDFESVKKKLSKNNFYPDREYIFGSMDECPLDKVKVVLCGQDPYPGTYFSTVDGKEKPYACGLSFSIPHDATLTPTLSNLFSEYVADLHYPRPVNGVLIPWTKEGVLLWNVYPSCQKGVSLSHRWEEWENLTKEVFQVVSKQGAIFILLGAIARQFKEFISEEDSYTIEAPHPMADRYSQHKKDWRKPKILFSGSRIFSRSNDLLCNLGMGQIDWRLP